MTLRKMLLVLAILAASGLGLKAETCEECRNGCTGKGVKVRLKCMEACETGPCSGTEDRVAIKE